MIDFLVTALRLVGRVVPWVAQLAYEIGSAVVPSRAAPKNDGTDDPQETS